MAAKKITTQTLKEFQAWLDGVEELQTKGWTPDKQQWAKIRKRIANIVDAPAPQQFNPMHQPMQPVVGPGGVAPMMPGPAPMMPGPAPIPNYDISPAAQALLNGATGKTPDIDASAGPVDSPFS